MYSILTGSTQPPNALWQQAITVAYMPFSLKKKVSQNYIEQSSTEWGDPPLKTVLLACNAVTNVGAEFGLCMIKIWTQPANDVVQCCKSTGSAENVSMRWREVLCHHMMPAILWITKSDVSCCLSCSSLVKQRKPQKHKSLAASAQQSTNIHQS
jgi:hypothetical protein